MSARTPCINPDADCVLCQFRVTSLYRDRDRYSRLYHRSCAPRKPVNCEITLFGKTSTGLLTPEKQKTWSPSPCAFNCRTFAIPRQALENGFTAASSSTRKASCIRNQCVGFVALALPCPPHGSMRTGVHLRFQARFQPPQPLQHCVGSQNNCHAPRIQFHRRDSLSATQICLPQK